MANIFSEKDKFSPHLKRNAFDLSFQNNLTLPFGKIVPIFCKETLPGDSWDIDCALGLNFMPMVYPVQSKIYVNVHFYYVRNRALWSDWKDFIFRTKDGLVPPYISQSDDSPFWGTGSLSDYFGIPTDFDIPVSFSPYFNMGYGSRLNNSTRIYSLDTSYWQFYTHVADAMTETEVTSTQPGDVVSLAHRSVIFGSTLPTSVTSIDSFLTSYPYGNSVDWPSLTPSDTLRMLVVIPINIKELTFQGSSLLDSPQFFVRLNPRNTPLPFETPLTGNVNYFPLQFDGTDWMLRSDLAFNGSFTLGNITGQPFGVQLDASSIFLNTAKAQSSADTPTLLAAFCEIPASAAPYFYDAENERSYTYRPTYGYSYAIIQRTDILRTFNPFGSGDGTGTPAVRVSALPFRAYESIYNSYYRNQQNDPFTVDGQIEYNKFITNSAGGADTTRYDFFARYWEPDFLTTAMPSPQQGIAPLVGVNAAGVFTFRNPDTLEEYQAQALIGEDGETLTGIGVHSPDMPTGSLRSLMTAVQHGLSINDFRNVNSLQRWLETNLRRGYKYRDLMDAHFGINVRYNELDMPEFIGGLSTMVDIQKIINNTESSDSSPLGSFAGLGSAFGQFSNRIQKYTDEHGFIIGVMSVNPVPTYTQVIPKFYLKNDPLDYYTPEFAKIGMQPIFNSEVSPILANYEDKLNEVFGYQKAWYEYMSSIDEAHGDFRSTLRNYVMYRRFASTPELGSDFLNINMDDVNDVFADTTLNDKILGRILFQVTKKTVIPRHIIPGLE